MARTLRLVVRNVLFTVVVPGRGGAWVPWWILTRYGRTSTPAAWEAIPVIAAGAVLYLWCVWNFAAVGSPPLLAYAGAMALFFHLFVTGYEERALRGRFGRTYPEYRRTVPRWIPRSPRHG
jgi:hypothetical protein